MTQDELVPCVHRGCHPSCRHARTGHGPDHPQCGHERAHLLTACGVAAGQAIWAVATSAGLVALLLASEPIFVFVKLAVAAYLIVLRLQAVFAWLSFCAIVSPRREIFRAARSCDARLKAQPAQSSSRLGWSWQPISADRCGDGTIRSLSLTRLVPVLAGA